ncbi:hypothetical protein L486_06045 [Kwoniella mangroviensis CBS 10435]|uniref:Uncharacterized protein n=1 Tax=Kwoniella mangroviensis CBS 10435 TaxID=1331196 RepID=A0A1B9IL50_9TREE|nr:hypothetical protein L486_06045 [Kwoniella mangroviensis CBS 10435]
MLKDIVERPSKPPSAPSAPTPGGAGFPVAVHRSQRPSAFAKARQQQAARQSGQTSRVIGEGKAVDLVPSIGVSTTPHNEGVSSQGKLSEMEQVRQSVEVENVRRVEGMSSAEREEEVEELKERFGSGIVDLMKKRKEAREGRSPHVVEDIPASNESGPSSRPLDLTDSHKILDEVSEENRRKVESMNDLERDQEVEELQDRFGGKLMDALRKRAEARIASRKGKERQGDGQPADAAPTTRSSDRSPTSSTTAPSTPAKPRPQPRTDPDDPSLSELKAYFPSVPSESSKLAWLQPLPPSTSSSANSPRFDLSGNILSAAEQSELPSHLGLHHHGSSPDLAGYTIHEILYLCRSTVPSQKITMMGLLTKVLRKCKEGKYDDGVMKEVEENESMKKAIDLGVEILAGLSRGIGVIESGVELLYEAVNGSSWTWIDDYRDQDGPVRFTVDENILSIPFEDVLPRLKELLSIEDGLSTITIWQILRMLRRATYTSKDLCEVICPIISSIIKVQVVAKPWPPTTTTTTSSLNRSYPSIEALRLLRDMIVSSRECAEDLVNQGIFEGILKFVVTATWDDEQSNSEYTSYSLQLALEVLQIFTSLGKYGLASNTLTSSSELWTLLGKWVKNTVNKPDLIKGEKRLSEGHLKLLEIWITCAIDPHRTTPEHDLTWAQVSAMNYQDEALSILQSSKDYDILAAGLELLGAWIKGAKINGVRGGEEEKGSLLEALKETPLESLVLEITQKDACARSDGRLLAAAVQVHRLLLSSRGLFSIDTIDGLQAKMPTSSRHSSRYFTYLQYELLSHTVPTLITSEWLSHAFNLFGQFQIGDEPLALDLLDIFLKSDSSSLLPEIKEIGHPDGTQILRPLLQYSILPSSESVVGPHQPTHLYLKATTTLRPPALVESEEKPALPGLPLRGDWFFCPLDELLRSGTSEALQQIPPDWNATEVQITRATLVLAKLFYVNTNGVKGLGSKDRASLILGLMKVHMLEHGQTSSNVVDEVEVFRDNAVSGLMRDLMGLLTTKTVTKNEDEDQDIEEVGDGDVNAQGQGELEIISIPFLGTGVPFYQFYQDFLQLYESISFSDPLFTQLLLPVLSMDYSRDYRKLIWVDHHSLLKNIRTTLSQVPIIGRMKDYYQPLETDQEILTSYARAVVSGMINREKNEFIWSIAINHLSGLFWLTHDEEMKEVRVGLMMMVLSKGSDDLVRSVLKWDFDMLKLGMSGDLSEEEKAKRNDIAGKLAGARGSKRIDGMI